MQVLGWQRRAEPLAPAGVVTFGAATQLLLARLALASEEALASLSVVATRDMMVLMTAAGKLPWIDGARYCAPDPDMPSLWLPTTMAPVLAPDLVRRSLAGRVGAEAVLLWNEPEQLLPLHAPRSLTPALVAWFAEQSQ
jgi:hypothetical protein